MQVNKYQDRLQPEFTNYSYQMQLLFFTKCGNVTVDIQLDNRDDQTQKNRTQFNESGLSILCYLAKTLHEVQFRANLSITCNGLLIRRLWVLAQPFLRKIPSGCTSTKQRNRRHLLVSLSFLGKYNFVLFCRIYTLAFALFWSNNI